MEMKLERRAGSVLKQARKWVLLISGLVCTGLGVLGIVVPLLPTVPFLLLAVFCFARSSERLHCWLLEHRHLGPLIAGFLAGSGIPLRAKATAIVLIWLTLSLSAVLLVFQPWVRGLLFAVGAVVTAYLLRLPTASTPG